MLHRRVDLRDDGMNEHPLPCLTLEHISITDTAPEHLSVFIRTALCFDEGLSFEVYPRKIRMHAYRVSLHGVQNRRHSGPP